MTAKADEKVQSPLNSRSSTGNASLFLQYMLFIFILSFQLEFQESVRPPRAYIQLTLERLPIVFKTP